MLTNAFIQVLRGRDVVTNPTPENVEEAIANMTKTLEEGQRFGFTGITRYVLL